MKIIYKKTDNSISILTPSLRCLQKHTLESVALKDVPEGLPFWIVDDTEIPTDRTFRNAWELPEGYRMPDGYGSTYRSFKEIENADGE